MKIVIAVGTRPEAIKMAPVIQQLRQRKNWQCLVCATAQHRQMLDQAFDLFDISPDVDFDVMRSGQSLNQVTTRIIEATDKFLQNETPDLVLVHGDTTTAMAVGLASFHRNIDVGHVEAGLRTYDLTRPFPEEMNRRVIDLVARYLFAPTEISRSNLLNEKSDPSRIFVTGNTVVDSLHSIIARLENDPAAATRSNEMLPFPRDEKPIVLITGHRRESFGTGFENICRAIAHLANKFDFNFVYPVHLNPNVTEPVNRILKGLKNVFLLPPVSYLDFVALLWRSKYIITDSGGVQEEAVSLGKHVLVMRDVTERPEGIEVGLAQLVGTNVERITSAFEVMVNRSSTDLIENRHVYGDGHAARRIVDIIAGHHADYSTHAAPLETTK